MKKPDTVIVPTSRADPKTAPTTLQAAELTVAATRAGLKVEWKVEKP